MIAQLELALVQELQQELALVRVQQQVLELAPALVQELQLVLVRHLPHQPLQSQFQQQRSHLLQHEFLSILQQLVKALQYQLCL